MTICTHTTYTATGNLNCYVDSGAHDAAGISLHKCIHSSDSCLCPMAVRDAFSEHYVNALVELAMDNDDIVSRATEMAIKATAQELNEQDCERINEALELY